MWCTASVAVGPVKRYSRKRRLPVFYRLLNYMCDIDIPADTGDFRLMSRRVVDAFKQLRERHRFVRGMVPWLGYTVCAAGIRPGGAFCRRNKISFSKDAGLCH